MGAGDRSYLVRDNEISVFKNRYGGVEVLPQIQSAFSAWKQEVLIDQAYDVPNRFKKLSQRGEKSWN